MDGKGHGAFGFCSFRFRPEHNGEGGKNRDRDHGRADQGGCILGEHVAGSHAKIGHRDDERQGGGREEGKRQQVVLGKYALVEADRNDADDEKAPAKEDEAGHDSRTREEGGQVEFDAACDEKQRNEKTRADRHQAIFENLPPGIPHQHRDHHSGRIGAKDKFHAEFIGEGDEPKQDQNGYSHRQNGGIVHPPGDDEG